MRSTGCGRMTVAEYDLGYYEGVRNALMIALRINNNTEEMLKAMKEELADAEKCMDESQDYDKEV